MKKNPCDCHFLAALYESEGVPKEVACDHRHYCPKCKASCCSESGIITPLENVDLDPAETPWYCPVCDTRVVPIRLAKLPEEK